MKITSLFLANLLFLLLLNVTGNAQMITGVWRGKINWQKAEVKLIQDGDSLRGTSYYYDNEANYRRYSVKGYFNTATNEAIWWDDQLLEEKTGKLNISGPGKNALLSSADFNCPGSGKMTLDGNAGKKEEQNPRGEVHLDKVPQPAFEDEWDFVIDNYLSGANDPYIIDSISSLATLRNVPVEQKEVVIDLPKETKAPARPPVAKNNTVVAAPAPPIVKTPADVPVQTIEEKFVSRKKILTTEIPVSGDSIELRFYDNAEIDGDSISLFLNDKIIFRHIRLTGSAYTIKLAVQELGETNELIMVAENLGSIPPNTSYMVAIVGQERYEARLESTEGSSAMVRFTKKTR